MERVIRPWKATLAPAAAEQFLRFGFDSDDDKQRSVELSEKVGAGTATEVERREPQDLVSANGTLMLLQSKRRLSLAAGRDDGGR